MKKEIKFRAWTGSEMEHKVVVGQLGAFYVQGLDPKDSASLSNFNTLYPNATPIMQFTGLTDKNGKDIYDGDIIDWAGEHILAVKFTDFGWRASDKMEIVGEYLCNIRQYSEVIGNIYQNNELLLT